MSNRAKKLPRRRSFFFIIGFAALIMVGTLLGVLAYHVFIAHTALSITIGVAIGLTVADLILHEVVQGVMFSRLS